MGEFIKKSDIIDLIKEKLSDINAIQKDTIIPEERIVLNKMIKLYKDFCSDIENMKEHEYVQPKHSYFESIYHVGSEPRWKVGDVLAIYNFYRDYEGEEELGEIVDIYMDEDNTLTDKEYNSIREAHDYISNARDILERLIKQKK